MQQRQGNQNHQPNKLNKINRQHSYSEYKNSCPPRILILGSHRECCVAIYNDKVLNSVQTWLLGFSASTISQNLVASKALFHATKAISAAA